jgi:cytochrome c oxidase subunit 3
MTEKGEDAFRTMRLGVIAGGLLGIAFLFGQVLLWRHYDAAGYYLSANPANAFFYLLTAIHGLHLIGGLAAWLRVLARPRLSSIRLCALYWHSLLLIWVLLAGLLLST